MTASGETRDAGVDGLYALALDEFTVARDELARSLRGQGKREAAQAVKALRKPSLTAWALNQVSRDEPERVSELIAAGERLRDATQRLLAQRDRAPLSRATVQERELVRKLAELGGRKLAAAGHPVSPAAHQRLLATLHAVASDPEARDLLVAGRLARDYEVSDLGLGLGPVTEPEETAHTKPTPDRKAGAADRAAAARAAKLDAVRAQLESARASQEALDVEADGAQQRADEARQEVARASAALARAEAASDRARAGAARAATKVAALQTSLRELESRQD